jgi:hypothetical protein
VTRTDYAERGKEWWSLIQHIVCRFLPEERQAKSRRDYEVTHDDTHNSQA